MRNPMKAKYDIELEFKGRKFKCTVVAESAKQARTNALVAMTKQVIFTKTELVEIIGRSELNAQFGT